MIKNIEETVKKDLEKAKDVYDLCCEMLSKGQLTFSSVTPTASDINPMTPISPLPSSAYSNRRSPCGDRRLRATTSCASREAGKSNRRALRNAMSSHNSMSSNSSAVGAKSSTKKPQRLKFRVSFSVVCVVGILRIMTHIVCVRSLLTSLQGGCGSEESDSEDSDPAPSVSSCIAAYGCLYNTNSQHTFAPPLLMSLQNNSDLSTDSN